MVIRLSEEILVVADADLRWNSHDYDLTLRGDFSWPSTSKWTSGTGTITLSGTAAQDIDFNGESVEHIDNRLR
jgi:hypothetical protein